MHLKQPQSQPSRALMKHKGTKLPPPNNLPKVEGWLVFGDTHFGEDSGWGATGCTGRVCLAASFIRLICLLWNISCTSPSFCRTSWALACRNKSKLWTCHSALSPRTWSIPFLLSSPPPPIPSPSGDPSIHMQVIAQLALHQNYAESVSLIWWTMIVSFSLPYLHA